MINNLRIPDSWHSPGVNWLLEAIALEALPFFALLNPSEFDRCVNFPVPEWPPSDLVGIVIFLIDQGAVNISLYSMENGTWELLSHPVEILLQEAERTSEKSFDWTHFNYWQISISLTQLGGAIWEEHAEPSWEKKVVVNYPSPSPDAKGEPIQVMGLSLQSNLEQLSMRGVKIVENSLRWAEFDNWKPLYWKTFPKGCVVECEAETRRDGSHLYHSFFGGAVAERWYKNSACWTVEQFNEAWGTD